MKNPSNSESFTGEVERSLAASLAPTDQSGSSGLLSVAARHLSLAPGAKRLRPRLIRFLGEELDVDSSRLLGIAVAAELIHSASLLHDDVVDDGGLRRGRPTTNARFGNQIAVLAGDWALSQALLGLQQYPQALSASAVQTVVAMTEAAVSEVDARGRLDLTLVEWRKIVAGKTGALFAWSARAVALTAGREDAAEKLAAFGFHLGIAFQLADDLRDLLEPGGKDRFSDLKNRNLSYALLSIAADHPSLGRQIAELWARPTFTSAEVETLGLRLAEGPWVQSLHQALEAEVTAALNLLKPHLRDPEGAMEGLAEKLLGPLQNLNWSKAQ